MIKITNKNLSVEINEKGGCLNSIKKDGYEYLWQGSEDSWTGKDVAIFPFIARLKGGEYLVNGETYSMKNHGLCRYAILDVEKKEEDEVTVSLEANEATLAQYPYKFKFSANYSLKEGNLKVTYIVNNIDNKDIYFGLGGHPAFNIPFERVGDEDNIDGNTIVFEEKISPNNYYLTPDGSFITHKDKFEDLKEIHLSKKIFQKYKTLMLCDAKINKVQLLKKDGKNVTMYLNNPDTVAIWTKEKFGGYICIEPWCGIPDLDNPEKEMSKKLGINKLKVGETFKFSYTIEV